MDAKNKVFGWIFIAYAAITLAIVLGAFWFMSGFMFTGGHGQIMMESQHNPMLSVFGGTALVLAVLVSVLGIAAGFSMIKQRPHAHKLTLPYAVICLFNVPVGTVIGGLYLWFYLNNSS